MQGALLEGAVWPRSRCGHERSVLQLQGMCSMLNGRMGCCSGDVAMPDLQALLASCPRDCNSLVQMWWCALTCLDLSLYHSDGTLVVHKASIKQLQEACNPCKVPISPGPSIGAVNREYKWDMLRADGYDFGADLRACGDCPSLVNISVSPTSQTITTATGETFVYEIYILSATALISGSLYLAAPSGALAWSSALTFTSVGSSLWQATASFVPTWYGPNGTWYVNSVSAENNAGSMPYALQKAASATQTVFYPGSNWGSLTVCESGDTHTTAWSPGIDIMSADAVGLCGNDSVTLYGILGNTFTVTALVTGRLNWTIQELHLQVNGSWVMEGTQCLTLADGGIFTLNTNAQALVAYRISLGYSGASNKFVVAAGAVLTQTAEMLVDVDMHLYGSWTISGVNVSLTESLTVNGVAASLSSTASLLFYSDSTLISCASISAASVVVGNGVLTGYTACSLSSPLSVVSEYSTVQDSVTYSPPVVATCQQNFAFGTTVFEHGTTLQVLTCSTTGCTCTTTNPIVAASMVGNLTLRRGAVLQFTEVGAEDFGGLDVVGWIDFEVGSTVKVSVSGRIADTTLSIFLMSYSNLLCDSTMLATVIVTPALNPARVWTQRCENGNATTGASSKLYLDLGAVVVANTESTVWLRYTAASEYFVTLQQTCARYFIEDFYNALSSVTISNRTDNPIDGRQVNVTQAGCVTDEPGGIRIQFTCMSSISTADADALCQQIVADASDMGHPLYFKLRVYSSGTASTSSASSDDDTGPARIIIVLLLLVPLLTVAKRIVQRKLRQRRADNQYMQDTAMFSHAISQCQPMAEPDQDVPVPLDPREMDMVYWPPRPYTYAYPCPYGDAH